MAGNDHSQWYIASLVHTGCNPFTVGSHVAIDTRERSVHEVNGLKTTAVVLGTLDIVAAPAEVAPARHWLSKLLADDYAAVLDDAVLMACEAITNSVCHSDSGSADGEGKRGTVKLVVLEAGGVMRVEVIDAGSQSSTPRVTDDGLDALSGRGLRMLEMLSEGRWGSYANADCRTVWFEIATDEQSTSDSGEP